MLQVQPRISEWKKKKVEFVTVTSDTKQQTLEQIQKGRLRGTVLLDEKGDAAVKYEVTGIPADFFINRQGELEGRLIGWGGSSMNELESWIQKK